MSTLIVWWPSVEHSALLDDLAEKWPIGQRVRHRRSAWRGVVTTSTPRHCPGLYVGTAPAHCIIPAAPGLIPAAVCVEWDHPSTQLGAGDRDPFRGTWPDPRVGPAWMRPGLLWPVGRDVPRRAVMHR